MEKVRLLSVVLPTYNEKENVVPLVQAVHVALDGIVEHEVLVVDDNSPDGTYEAVRALNQPWLKPILRTEDRGFANSLRCGAERSHGDAILFMDSDGNHQPKYLPFMVDSLRFYDCVSGSRFLYGGAMNHRARHLLSLSFNQFVRLATGGQMTDSLYGLVAIRRASFERLNLDEIFWGYGDYCIRLLYHLQRSGASILEFPAVNGERLNGKGNDRLGSVFVQYTREVLKLAVTANRGSLRRDTRERGK
jgi:dolichol-phosphate mannosyltransferase